MVSNKEKNFISAVVYVHNNADRIERFLIALIGVLDEYFEKFEIICVNDCSTDNSADIIRHIAPQNLRDNVLTILNMGFYQGIEPSMTAGVNLAIGDFVYEFDNNDIDYEIGLIMQVYQHSLKGYDIVSTANTNRRFSSSAFYWLYNRSVRTHQRLRTEIFRILSRRAINRIHSMSHSVPYRKALYMNCGLKTDVILYKPERNAEVVHSTVQMKYRQETAWSTLILFTDVAYKLSMVMTVLMLFVTLAGGIYTLVVYLLQAPVAGYTTTMLLLTGCFFGVFAILAVIIKYLSVLIDLIFKKQSFIIESIEKINK